MRSDRLLQLGTNDHTRALSSWTTAEKHDACTSFAVTKLKQASSDTERNTCTPQWTLVIRNWPRVSLQLLESVSQLEFALRDGQEEACVDISHGHLRSSGLLRHIWSGSSLAKAKHFVNLLRRVVLVTAEDVRLGTFGIAKLMYLGLKLLATFHV